MPDTSPPEGQPKAAGTFAEEVEKPPTGIIRDFWDYLRDHRKMWLIPIIVSLLLAGLIAVAGGTIFAPFIYALF